MFMNSMADCHREAGGIIDDGTSLGELWDWDSVQLVANSRPDAVAIVDVDVDVESEGGVGDGNDSRSWNRNRNGALAAGKRARGRGRAGGKGKVGLEVAVPSPSSVEAEESQSPDVTEQLSSMSGGKQDACPNAAAGRTLCGCTDNDEEEDVVSRKRTRATAKCQVEACREDLGRLKGYHQRHRVCLRCANAITVKLKGEAHRYCQQCGKFHKLTDFDDEKRSCRRKLERHNTRRRRKMMESGEGGVQQVPDGQVGGEDKSSPSPATENSVSMDQGPVSGVLESEPAFKLASTLSSSSMDAAVGRCCGTTTVSSCMDSLQSSVMCGLSQSTDTLGLQLPTLDAQLQPATSGAGLHSSEAGGVGVGAANGFPNSMFGDPVSVATTLPPYSDMAGEVNARNWGASSGEVSGQQFGFNPGKSGPEEESLLSFLLEDDLHGDNFFPNPKIPGAHDADIFFQQHPSSYRALNRKAPTYSSPFPSGRISFKLYDWNPGDFPRRLRQQILEWIGNMPVELEGYIRSGCTILTLFLSMEQQMWDDLEANWPAYVTKLVQGSGGGFWDSGHFIACLGEQVCEVLKGHVTDIRNNGLKEKLAKLDFVWPVCMEAGSSTNVQVHGKNLRRGEVRPFLSFGGKYLAVDRSENGQGMQSGKDRANGDTTSYELRIPAVNSGRSGVVYVEFENNHGTSNHVPLLVADAEVCAELQTLMSRLGLHSASMSAHLWRMVHMLLLDLGWVLSYPERYSTPERLDTFVGRQWHAVRLRRLLRFALDGGCPSVAGRILSAASSFGVSIPAQLDDALALENPTISKVQEDFLRTWLADAGLAQQSEPLEIGKRGAPLGHDDEAKPASTSVESGALVDPVNYIGHRVVDIENLKEPFLSSKAASDLDMEHFWASRRRTRRYSYRNPTFANQHVRIGARSVMTMVGVLAVCVGACFVFQHPQGTMDYLSVSLRRCLWGSSEEP